MVKINVYLLTIGFGKSLTQKFLSGKIKTTGILEDFIF